MSQIDDDYTGDAIRDKTYRVINIPIDVIRKAAKSKDDAAAGIFVNCTCSPCLNALYYEPEREVSVWRNTVGVDDHGKLVLERECDCVYAIGNRGNKPVTVSVIVAGSWTVTTFTVGAGKIEWVFEGMPVMLQGLKYYQVHLFFKDLNGNPLTRSDGDDAIKVDIYGAFFKVDVRKCILSNPFLFYFARPPNSFVQMNGMMHPQRLNGVRHEKIVNDLNKLQACSGTCICCKRNDTFVSLHPLQTLLETECGGDEDKQYDPNLV